jgi:hypothetical protein
LPETPLEEAISEVPEPVMCSLLDPVKFLLQANVVSSVVVLGIHMMHEVAMIVNVPTLGNAKKTRIL